MPPLKDIIRQHRKKANLTQAGLAQLAGVGKTVVWDLENGKESVQWDTLQKILRVLNITVTWHSPLLDRASWTAPESPSPAATFSAMPPAPTKTHPRA